MPCEPTVSPSGNIPMLGCCPTGPASIRFARATSGINIGVFHSHGAPFSQQFFCGRRFFRRCVVTAPENGVCGLPGEIGHADSAASIAFPTEFFIQDFGPCVTNDNLTRSAFPDPEIITDTSITTKLANNSSQRCWDAAYAFSVEVTINDIVAACLSNLALIDLAQVPLGTQRTVSNDSVTGAPIFGDSLIATRPSIGDFCTGFLNENVAGNFGIKYTGTGEIFACSSNTTFIRRVQMPVFFLVVTASRSRFEATAPWCRSQSDAFFTDPNFTTTCNSTRRFCSTVACDHFAAASGTIEVPTEPNTSVAITLCTTPPVPCNPTPRPFP